MLIDLKKKIYIYNLERGGNLFQNNKKNNIHDCLKHENII